MPKLQQIATHIIAFALVLRALVPVGWMHATGSHQESLIPCPMMDGMRGMAMPKQPAQSQHPTKHQLPLSHEGSICPFATAAQPTRAFIPHRIAIDPAHFAFLASVIAVPASPWDHVPRAPPGQNNPTPA